MAAVPRLPGVLVVDDDPMLLDLLQRAFTRRGFRVRVGSSGQQGLELYRQHRDEIDVVLLDVRMPGLDGPATLRMLREVNPDVRACFMSGHTGAHSPEALRGMSVDGFFEKPFPVLKVADDVWELVSSARVV